jgi:predicted alpha/beta-fold hydrolase
MCLSAGRSQGHSLRFNQSRAKAGWVMSPDFQSSTFHPRAWLQNGHLQTIFGNFLPRPSHLPSATRELVAVAPATHGSMASQVLCLCHWQPESVRADRMTVIVLHGLEGSAESQYVVGNANKMWRAGMNVVRMNMRNCGGTEALSSTLYHSGLSGDVLAVLTTLSSRFGLRQAALVGYSMGGNLVLKLAGDLGTAPPSQLKAVVGVSPAVDLDASATALHEPLNRIYEWRFVRALIQRFRRKAQLLPRVYDPARAYDVKTLRDFDQRITAFYAGFAGAKDYYFRAAAARVLNRIAVPTLILHAEDDPFVRLTPETRAKIAANPQITMLETEHGGHCAFLSRRNRAEGDDGYWAETTLLRFLRAHDAVV